jgi:hypothetical protein
LVRCAALKPLRKTYEIVLYVTGDSPYSLSALEEVQNLKMIYPEVDFKIEVVDVLEASGSVDAEAITITPTLICYRPLPVQKLTGDLSDLAQKLGLKARPALVTPCVPLQSDRDTFGSMGIKK